MIGRKPAPLTKGEFEQLLSKGCLNMQDSAAITLAVYTSLRPGELCALGVEDIELVAEQIKVSMAITADGTFKVPKTGKARAVHLMPPAIEAFKTLMDLVIRPRTT